MPENAHVLLLPQNRIKLSIIMNPTQIENSFIESQFLRFFGEISILYKSIDNKDCNWFSEFNIVVIITLFIYFFAIKLLDFSDNLIVDFLNATGFRSEENGGKQHQKSNFYQIYIFISFEMGRKVADAENTSEIIRQLWKLSIKIYFYPRS